MNMTTLGIRVLTALAAGAALTSSGLAACGGSTIGGDPIPGSSGSSGTTGSSGASGSTGRSDGAGGTTSSGSSGATPSRDIDAAGLCTPPNAATRTCYTPEEMKHVI